MLIRNITNVGAPKPIGIGPVVIMPGEAKEVPDDIAYVDKFDEFGHKTGEKAVLPAIVILAGMNQIAYTENKKVEKQEPDEEKIVAEKPKRGRKKTDVE